MNEILKGKTAIITGASRGLGFEIAKLFAQNGANIVICSRSEKSAREAADLIRESLSGSDPKIVPVSCDMGEEADINRLFETAVNECGGFDILVNNAAIQGPIGPIETNNWDEWKNTINTDMLGPVYAMRLAIDHFKKNQKCGKIINISGGGATGSRPNFSSYAAAKVTLVRLSEILADENRQYGIDINAIAPGAMRSAMTYEIMKAGDKAGDKEISTAEKLINEGDTCKDKAASLALFLASDKSNGLSGKLISAVWDDWALFADTKEDIPRDMYTLRRVTPEQ